MRQSWYTEQVTHLFHDNLGFQISYSVIVALQLVYYSFTLSKEQVLHPKSRPYTNLVYFNTSAIILLTFISIGPWSINGKFWVLFIFQILQLFVYSVLSFCLLSNFGRPRILCVGISVQAKRSHALLIRFYTVLCEIVLALWIHYSYNLACLCIDDAVVKAAIAANKDMKNLLLLLTAANLILSSFHIAGSAAELLWAFIACGWNGKARVFHRKFAKIHVDDHLLDVSYDVSDD